MSCHMPPSPVQRCQYHECAVLHNTCCMLLLLTTCCCAKVEGLWPQHHAIIVQCQHLLVATVRNLWPVTCALCLFRRGPVIMAARKPTRLERVRCMSPASAPVDVIAQLEAAVSVSHYSLQLKLSLVCWLSAGPRTAPLAPRFPGWHALGGRIESRWSVLLSKSVHHFIPAYRLIGECAEKAPVQLE